MRTKLLALFLLLGGPGAPAAAEPGPHSDPGPRWEISITPYAWLPAIDGDIAAGDVEADVDVSNTDALSAVNWAGFLEVEVRRGRWLVIADAFGVNATSEISSDIQTVRFPGVSLTESFSRNATKTVEVGPVEYELGPAQLDGTVNLDIPGFDVAVGPVDVEVNTQLVMADLTLGYRLLDRPVAGIFGGEVADDDARRLTLDLFGGGRYWDVKGWINVGIPPVTTPSFTVTPTAAVTGTVGGGTLPRIPVEVPELRAPRDIEFDAITIPEGDVISGGSMRVTLKERWVDPIIGLRARGDFAEKWYWVVSGDVGGFGIGSASNFTWQALVGIGWRFGEHWSTQLSWRALEIHRRDANSDIRLRLQGPQLGFTYRF